MRTPQNDGVEISDEMQPRFLNALLKADSAFVGRRLREAELDTLNVEVRALRRYNVHGAQPSEEMILQSGDVLVLLGLPEALEMAETRLHKGNF
jgi:CPA2 family monovalent cation:H+ antiporter-2